MIRLFKWMGREIYSTIPAILFFGISFNLLHFSTTLMMGPEQVRFTSYFGATIGAIIAGKIIIIVRSLPFINAFPHKPLVYNICWKFMIYGFFVLLVQILDFILRKYHHLHNMNTVSQLLKAQLVYPMFWGVQILILFLFLIFICFSELERVIGPKEFKRLFLG